MPKGAISISRSLCSWSQPRKFLARTAILFCQFLIDGRGPCRLAVLGKLASVSCSSAPTALIPLPSSTCDIPLFLSTCEITLFSSRCSIPSGFSAPRLSSPPESGDCILKSGVELVPSLPFMAFAATEFDDPTGFIGGVEDETRREMGALGASVVWSDPSLSAPGGFLICPGDLF